LIFGPTPGKFAIHMLGAIFRVVNNDASIVFRSIQMILQRLSIAYFAGASTTFQRSSRQDSASKVALYVSA